MLLQCVQHLPASTIGSNFWAFEPCVRPSDVQGPGVDELRYNCTFGRCLSRYQVRRGGLDASLTVRGFACEGLA